MCGRAGDARTLSRVTCCRSVRRVRAISYNFLHITYTFVHMHGCRGSLWLLSVQAETLRMREKSSLVENDKMMLDARNEIDMSAFFSACTNENISITVTVLVQAEPQNCCRCCSNRHIRLVDSVSCEEYGPPNLSSPSSKLDSAD